MSDFSLAGLARKWCPAMEHSQPYSAADRCCCGELTGALREALEEAERVIQEYVTSNPALGPLNIASLQVIAAAIAALHKSP